MTSISWVSAPRTFRAMRAAALVLWIGLLTAPAPAGAERKGEQENQRQVEFVRRDESIATRWSQNVAGLPVTLTLTDEERSKLPPDPDWCGDFIDSTIFKSWGQEKRNRYRTDCVEGILLQIAATGRWNHAPQATSSSSKGGRRGYKPTKRGSGSNRIGSQLKKIVSDRKDAWAALSQEERDGINARRSRNEEWKRNPNNPINGGNYRR